MTNSQAFEKKMRDLLDEIQTAYDMGYIELQTTIKDLQKNNLVKLQVLSNMVVESIKLMNDPKEIHKEILQISKDILEHLINPFILTKHDVNMKTQISFARVFELLKELKK
ncbi:unnamed protein product [Lactuca saligna]|uniref:Uncharacterized protein n=1 Tax=Lactuca saligna TaxID=75948 RepID=A0AA35UUT5_LACSI|nr:unnamed protein product [Lactuca saligna]